MIKDILVTMFWGAVVGGIFAFLRLPVPAPNSIPAVMGIVGMTLGFILIGYLLKTFG